MKGKTVLESLYNDNMEAEVKCCHEVMYAMGTPRITTPIKPGSRTVPGAVHGRLAAKHTGEAMRGISLNRLVTGLLLICGLMVLFSCSKPPRIAKLPSDGVVLAFGDSITFGTGTTPAESYPSVLEKRIGRRVVNAGVPGEVTSEGRERLASVLDEHNPAVMILCLGGNDFLRHQDETRTAENLRAMISMAKSRGVGVVLISVPKLGFGLEVPKLFADLAKELAIPLEGKALKQILSKRSLKSDPIHPNAAGYSILAESVAQLLRDSGAL